MVCLLCMSRNRATENSSGRHSDNVKTRSKSKAKARGVIVIPRTEIYPTQTVKQTIVSQTLHDVGQVNSIPLNQAQIGQSRADKVAPRKKHNPSVVHVSRTADPKQSRAKTRYTP